MSNDLVCPECGSRDFKQRRYAIIDCGIRVGEGGYEYDTDEDEIIDGGDRDEPIRCDDCGDEYDELSMLMTENTYNESEEA
jgi:hypothetical protein